MSFLVRTFWKPYLNALENYPLITKAGTAGTLLAGGDIIAQTVISPSQPFSYDVARTARMASVGLFLTGPMMHFWYKILDKTVTAKGLPGVVGKIVLDQSIFAPCIVSVFFISNGFFQGRSANEITSQLKRDMWPTMKYNWTVWPAAMAINFAFVPQNLRVLYVSSVALVWNTYLSLVGNKH
mmetsp:Transcript_29130/g.40996  ORF Transcript_29130/g.40996 Transcript_29130/m.40996 type:complete len:182 (-) Transcript_29130:52-597(-)